jgi:hypothetical protein
MPNHLIPADPFTAVIRMIACPDCPTRPGCNVHSPNPHVPEPCPTCAGYGDILAPEEVELYRRKAMALKDLPRPDFEERVWRYGS